MAFAIGATGPWPLVIAANRDEHLARPTAPLARWTTPTGTVVVSGRDLLDGGTWLGLTPAGRVAMLTNVRSGKAARGPRSRGELVLQWLQQDGDADDFARGLDPFQYGGFNLITGDRATGRWDWLSNRDAEEPSTPVAWRRQVLPPGLYGLSNAGLDTPWPKTLALKKALAKSLHDAAGQPAVQREDEVRQALFEALASRQRSPLDSLPATGVPAPLEQALSSAFVDIVETGYGTLCSTLVLAHADGSIRITERSHRETPPHTRSISLPPGPA